MSESTKPHHPNPQGKGEKTPGSDFSYVGIDAILEQMRRKAMKQGFELNIMVVGKLCTHTLTVFITAVIQLKKKTYSQCRAFAIKAFVVLLIPC